MKNAIALLLMGCASVVMADSLPEHVLACRALTDSAARLRCYDALALPARGSAVAAAVVAPVEATKAASPNAAQPATPAVAAAAAEQFGKPLAKTAIVDVIESSIPGLFEGWEPTTQWTLANGQIWRIADGSRASYSLVNPKVRIRRGVLGGFILEIDGENKAPKVRRIQ